MEITNNTATNGATNLQSAPSVKPSVLTPEFIDTFKKNAAIALDKSGQYSKMDQLQGFVYVRDTTLSKLMTEPNSDQKAELTKLSNTVWSESLVYQEAEAVGSRIMNAISDPSNNHRTADVLNLIDSLSDDQKEIYFQISQNSYDTLLGGKRYKDFNEFHSELVTHAVEEAAYNAKQAGGDDPSKNKDLADAMAILKLKDTDPNKFIIEALKKFTDQLNTIRDEINLSDNAKTTLKTLQDNNGNTNTDTSANDTKPYKEGDIVSKTV